MSRLPQAKQNVRIRTVMVRNLSLLWCRYDENRMNNTVHT